MRTLVTGAAGFIGARLLGSLLADPSIRAITAVDVAPNQVVSVGQVLATVDPTTLNATLAQAQASLAAMQRLHTATQNQLFEVQERSEDLRASRQSELDLATAELERVQVRVAVI